MGECDLVFLHASEFEDNVGLDIHIRTKIRYSYSYIESAALSIGDDILEVTSFGEYALNGIGAADLTASDNAKLAGYPIYYTRPTEKHHVFDIVIGPHQNITLYTFKDLVSVKITEGTKDHFGNSVGLMGSFSGDLLSRDGVIMSVDSDSDANAFGQEWQVLKDEPMLFRTARAPFAGEQCKVPTATQEKRRGLGNSIARGSAERACSHLSGTQFGNCVSDVMAVGDIELAQAAAY